MSALPTPETIHVDDEISLMRFGPSHKQAYVELRLGNLGMLVDAGFEGSDDVAGADVEADFTEFIAVPPGSHRSLPKSDHGIWYQGQLAGNLTTTLVDDRVTVDIWVDKDLHGRRIAARAVTAMLRQLAAEGNTAAWFNIKPENGFSREWAQRSGAEHVYTDDETGLEAWRLDSDKF